MKNVVALLYPGCIFFEIALATELLAKKYQVIFATPDGSDHQASNGMVIKPHSSFKNLSLENCHAVLVPGGDFDSIKDCGDSDRLLQAANDKKLWIAAICAGPFLLGKAGVIKNRTIAHGLGNEQKDHLSSYFKDVTFVEEKFFVDHNIITARPEAHIEFAVELAARLEAIDPIRATGIKEYYRGQYGQKIRPLALGLFENAKGQFLYHQGYDRIKKESYYRPLGGGIEFAEQGSYTLKREIQEELSLEVVVGELLGSFENIFTFEERHGHEVIMVFKAKFVDETAYSKPDFNIYESGHSIAKAVWRSLDEIKAEGANVYPMGLVDLIKKL
ncbi:MAG: DJ-1/PfpI family protein [Rhizobacter sp.]|nr:DJ-1/PfpI family protein [Bacteriovorax sp.]